MRPDELDDAAVPDQHHLEEALARPLRVLIAVGEDGLATLRHLDKLKGVLFQNKIFVCSSVELICVNLVFLN